MKPITKIALILILSLLTAPVILLKGCGTTTPAGSTLTASPTSISLTNISGQTCEHVQLILKDKDGKPLNGLPVSVYGGFAAPRNPARYRFYDGAACSGAPRDSGFTGITDDSGVYSFSAQIVAITNKPITPTCASVGNTPFTYRIATLDYNGEASPTSDSSSTCATGEINWAADARAINYAVIGRISGDLKLLAIVPGNINTTYNDIGAVSTASDVTNVTAVLGGISTPGAVTAYTYAVVPIDGAGLATDLDVALLVAAYMAPGVGPDTLSTIDYNVITWTPGATPGIFYAVYRQINAGSWTLLAVVSGLTYNDTGSAANASASSFTENILATSGTASTTIGITLN